MRIQAIGLEAPNRVLTQLAPRPTSEEDTQLDDSRESNRSRRILTHPSRSGTEAVVELAELFPGTFPVQMARRSSSRRSGRD